MKAWQNPLIGVCVCLVACLAYAQEPPAQPEAKPDAKAEAKPVPDEDVISDAELRDLVETVLTARLAKTLGLNDEQTVLLVRRLSEYKDKLGALRKERQAMAKTLKENLKSDKPDAEIQKNLDELVAKDDQIFEFRKNVYEKAGEGLTTAQRARLYVFLGDFESDMRQLVQKAREKAFRRGYGFGPPDTAASPQRRLQRGKDGTLPPPNGGRLGPPTEPGKS